MALQSREWKKVQLKQEKERNKYIALYSSLGHEGRRHLTDSALEIHRLPHWLVAARQKWNIIIIEATMYNVETLLDVSFFFSCDKNIIFTATENVGIMPWSETISRNRQHTDFKGSSSSVKSARIDVKFPLNWCQLCCPHDQIKIYK